MNKLLWLVAMVYSGVTMAASNNDLQPLEVGSYHEIAARPNPAKNEIMFIPSLAAILAAQEKKKGKPLTESEVIAIRDNATVTVGPPSKPQSLATSRGYDDIDATKVWPEWQKLRVSLSK